MVVMVLLAVIITRAALSQARREVPLTFPHTQASFSTHKTLFFKAFPAQLPISIFGTNYRHLKKIGPFCVKAKSKLLLLSPLCFEFQKEKGWGAKGDTGNGERRKKGEKGEECMNEEGKSKPSFVSVKMYFWNDVSVYSGRKIRNSVLIKQAK